MMPMPDDKGTGARDGSDRPAEPPPAPARPGMPDEESIVSKKPFTSPKGRRYQIIETDETDPYDQPAPPKPPGSGGGD
jgi:hypothetical protein